MEEATITQEGEQKQQLYQQGKYPSVIDTDDLVFELGKQLVGNFNKEKLLDVMLQKNKTIEESLIETNKIKLNNEQKVVDLEMSNKKYIENNQMLDSELVKIRKELKESMNKYETKVTLLEAENKNLFDKAKPTVKKRKILKKKD